MTWCPAGERRPRGPPPRERGYEREYRPSSSRGGPPSEYGGGSRSYRRDRPDWDRDRDRDPYGGGGPPRAFVVRGGAQDPRLLSAYLMSSGYMGYGAPVFPGMLPNPYGRYVCVSWFLYPYFCQPTGNLLVCLYASRCVHDSNPPMLRCCCCCPSHGRASSGWSDGRRRGREGMFLFSVFVFFDICVAAYWMFMGVFKSALTCHDVPNNQIVAGDLVLAPAPDPILLPDTARKSTHPAAAVPPAAAGTSTLLGATETSLPIVPALGAAGTAPRRNDLVIVSAPLLISTLPPRNMTLYFFVLCCGWFGSGCPACACAPFPLTGARCPVCWQQPASE